MRKLTLTSIALLSLIKITAQDIHFSQFHVNPLFFNPAMAGAMSKYEAGIQYRDQWQSIKNGFRTFGLSTSMNLADRKSKKAFFAFGINAFSDQAGDGKMKNIKVELPLAVHVNLNDKNTMGLGFVAGFGQRSFSMADLSWASQYNGMAYDASINSGETDALNNFSYLDMGTGLTWIYKGMTSNAADFAGISNIFGISMLHLNQPVYSFFGNTDEKLQPRIVIHEKMQIDLKNSKLALIPTFISQIQGPSLEIAGGLIGKYYIKPASKITGIESGTSASFGVLYRNADAIIVTTMFNYSTFSFGFSYDMNISGLTVGTQGRGGFEIALKYVFDQTESAGKRSF